jgi:signal transduction histidine kinase
VDDLVLGEVVGGVLAARLDAHYLMQQLRQASATEERIRLSRDLHDGVLQSFTGIALRLAAIRRMMEHDTQAAQALEETQRVLAQEQRDLRFLIEELKPGAEPAEGAQLAVRLEELARRMEREWDLRVQLSCAPPGGGWPVPICRDIYHIVRESLINAARHGAASTAQVEVAPDGDGAVAVCIADNGRGFPFTGRYSDQDLTRLNLGPKTLRERVRAVGGSLVLESNSSGAALRVVLPHGGGA